MEDYYAILDIPRTASLQEIKQSFQSLALKHHPDKLSSIVEPQSLSDKSASCIHGQPVCDTLLNCKRNSMVESPKIEYCNCKCNTAAELRCEAKPFHMILKAWRVLSDTKLKQAYDSSWTQRCISQDWPVQDCITIDEFELNSESEYVYPCRCGSCYLLSDNDASFKVDFVCCQSCSLCIQITYL